MGVAFIPERERPQDHQIPGPLKPPVRSEARSTIFYPIGKTLKPSSGAPLVDPWPHSAASGRVGSPITLRVAAGLSEDG